MEAICFSLYNGLHRAMLRKGNEDMAQWQSGLSHSKAHCCPRGMPVRHPASPNSREESRCTCQKRLNICSILKSRDLYVKTARVNQSPQVRMPNAAGHELQTMQAKVPTLLLTED